tara:strand:- start:3553 stop:4263 length:711 start_codon:yes stop_codon:yes gene_type:complete
MAIVEKTFRCGPTLRYDDSDWFEKKAISFNHINPSLEFYVKNNGSNFDDALVVGAGFGLTSKQLVDLGVTVVSIEPNTDRYNLLQTNVPESTNINKAVSNEGSTGSLVYYEDNKSGGSLDRNMGDSSTSVDVITVDSLNTNFDFISIHTNGTEIDVIKSAVNTMTANSDIKIHLKWIPDVIDDVDDSIAYLKSLDKTIKIIHWWEEDDSIELRTMYDGSFHEDTLNAVEYADLLLE